MARTTEGAVQKLLGSDADESNWNGVTPVTQFIEMATVIVTRVATCAARKALTLSSAELELIERNLAAHYYCRFDPLEQSTSTAGASSTYVTPKEGDTERYKQNALEIDFSGCLRAILSGKTARVLWGGKAPSAQVDYEDRD